MNSIVFKDYYLILQRYKSNLFTNENIYRCNFKFINRIFNNIVLEFDISIEDVISILENVYDLLEFNTSNTYIYFNNISNQNMNTYGISILNYNRLIIFEFNYNKDLEEERLTIDLDENYDIVNFIKDLYNIFLFDLNYEYINPVNYF